MPKFRDAVEFLPLHVCSGYTFDHRSIDKVAASYFRNMLRIQSLGRLPILLTGVALTTATFDMVARRQLQLEHDEPRLNPDDTLFDSVLFASKEAIRQKLQGDWFAATQIGEAKSGMTIGEDFLARMVSTGNAELSEGIQAVLVGMLTGMWTAFEVLVEDLWNAAIKERPHLNEGWSSKERELSGFKSVKRLKNHYNSTFRVESDAIQNIIGDERIAGLSLTRNVLVHALGRIDTTFDKRRRSIPSLACFSAFNLHDEIPITGPIVSHLICPFPILGLDLISNVDKWITTH